MATARRVYALFLFGKDRRLVLTKTPEGSWTLPSNSINDGEDEVEALMYGLCELGYDDASVARSIGPRHRFRDGSEATAYEVEVRTPVPFPDDMRPVTKEEAAALILVDEPAIRRMIWDGFSVMEPYQVCPKQVEGTIEEGIYCDPGIDHLLVEEVDAERREWPRLDPSSPTGKLYPHLE